MTTDPWAPLGEGQQYCFCGCGTVITLKRKDGMPRRFVNQRHALRHKRGLSATHHAESRQAEFAAAGSEWTHERLLDLQPEDMARLPFALVFGMVRWYAKGQCRVNLDQVRLLGEEARKRGMYGIVEHWIKRLLPSTCIVCGETAHRIVNQETYCPKHATLGANQLRKRDAVFARRNADLVAAKTAIDDRLKDEDRAARLRSATRKRRK